jgi:3-hydroxybutyryl-CoA dehydrogenase
MSDGFAVAVVGLGATGAGLAAAAAAHGLRVVAVARDAADEQRKGELESAGVTLGASIGSIAGAALVVEAVGESAAAKAEVLAEILAAADSAAVVATTATTLSVTDLALGTAAPDRLVGLRPSLPHRAPGAVEVVRTPLVGAAAVAAAVGFAEAVGAQATVVGDRPGQIVARLLFGYLNHAATMFEGRYATREDLDAAMRFGCGYPVGPLAMLDAIGLDTAYRILDGLHGATGERVHAPAPLLKQMIAAGRLGTKSGRGFYSYDGDGAVVADELTPGGAGSGAVQARPVQSVGVVGSGTMATGIMEVFAKAGFDVVFVARGEEKVARVVAAITKSLQRAVDKGRSTEAERDGVLARVRGVTDVAGLAEVDLVVEAIVEDLPTKLDLFRRLDAVCKPGAVLATTTSSLPVVEMAAVTARPGDVIGLHFFNPATIMKLVEVVVPVTTAPEVVATAHDVCRRTKKVAVECGDRAGFIVNALLFPYLNDAVRLLESGFASMDEIDTTVKAATGFPMGPFALLDVVGNDVSLAIQQTLLREFRDPGFTPAATLEHLVAAGYQGRKAGRGFRSY